MDTKKVIPIIFLAMFLLLIPLVSATQATSTTFHGQVLDNTGVPEQNADIRITLSTANSCTSSLIYNTTFTNATDINGVYNLDIYANLNFNQLYYTCVFVNTEQMGSPQPARIGQGQIDENDVYFTDLTIHNDLSVTNDLSVGNVGSELIPTLNNTYDIGSLTNMWKDLYLAGDLYVQGGVLGNLTYTNLIPIFDNTYVVGNETHRWSEGYFISAGIGDLNGSSPEDTLEVVGNIILSGSNSFIYADTQGDQGYNLTILGGWGGCFPNGTNITIPGGFKDISELKIGDEVVSYDISKSKETIAKVINVTTRNAPSYFIINEHIKVTAEHPFYINGKWVEAKDIKQGDYLFDGKNNIEVKSIRLVSEELFVYNLHVSEPNTFFAGGVLVHNKDTTPRPGGYLYLAGGQGGQGGANGGVIIGYDGSVVTGNVNISGAYVLPNTDGNTDQVLTTNGAGVAYWKNSTGTTFWSRLSGALFPSTSGDYIALNGSAGEGIIFDYNTENVSALYSSGSLDISSLNTNDIIKLFSDAGIRLDGGKQPVTIEATALDLRGNGIWGTGSNIQQIIYNSTQTRWNITPNIYSDGDVEAKEWILLLYDNGIEWGGNKTLLYDGSIDNRFEFNDDLDINGKLTANESEIGDGTNYVDINTTGFLTLFGSARVKKDVNTYAYNMYSASGTFNGVSCVGSGSSLLDRMGYMKTFDDGGGIGQCETAIMTLALPDDYESGTDISVMITWTTSATTGNVVWGIGVRAVGDGEDYTGVEVYNTSTESSPATAYYKKSLELSFSGTNYAAGDDVQIVVYRDADNAADTITGDTLVSTIRLKYIANKIGGTI